MPKPTQRVRILTFPYDAELFDARLETIRSESGSTGPEIVLTFAAFRPQSVPEWCDQDGHPHERITGIYQPMRLRFTNARWVRKTGIYENFDTLPPDHTGRRIFSILHSDQPSIGDFYWITTGADEPGELSLKSDGCQLEIVASESEAASASPEVVEIVRRWMPVPMPIPGYVPHRAALYRRYGGDPIAFRLGRRTYSNRFFIGGLHHQREERPNVHHVLNLCGLENPWCARSGVSGDDRYSYKGEMSVGMDAIELIEEATWVADRLRAGRRVLVHCYAGVNRSTTVCCAALMLIEGLKADEALARVRQYHPVAWPDPYHWFLLRWLSQALTSPVTRQADSPSTLAPSIDLPSAQDNADSEADIVATAEVPENPEDDEDADETAPVLREEVSIR